MHRHLIEMVLYSLHYIAKKYLENLALSNNHSLSQELDMA
jgi:hypothetical protein